MTSTQMKRSTQARSRPSQAVNKGHIQPLILGSLLLEIFWNLLRTGELKDSGLDLTGWHVPRGALLAGVHTPTLQLHHLVKAGAVTQAGHLTDPLRHDP